MSRTESAYYDYMRYDRDHSRAVLAHYVPFFADAAPVLELGSGRGEFLDLLRAAGITASGVDSDEGMVDATRAAGLDVVLGDGIAHLESVEPESLGGVFCAHFIEHLEPPVAARLLTAVRRGLRSGGAFVAVVPNAACLAVLTRDFWRDPTHVRFYDPDLIGFLCTDAGLHVVESGTNPANYGGPPPGTDAVPPVVHEPLTAEVALAIREATPEKPPKRRGGEGQLTEIGRLGHVISVLAERLTETQEQLRALHFAHSKLLDALYQPNEVYVVARG
ncbi:MAG: class I SAM-dependent methyltransferase [Mycobacteriales bacterium]